MRLITVLVQERTTFYANPWLDFIVVCRPSIKKESKFLQYIQAKLVHNGLFLKDICTIMTQTMILKVRDTTKGIVVEEAYTGTHPAVSAIH